MQDNGNKQFSIYYENKYNNFRFESKFTWVKKVMIQRVLEKKIQYDLFKGKAIIVFGPRQSGKTTLIAKVANNLGVPFLLKNGDEPDTRELFENATSTGLKAIIGDNRWILSRYHQPSGAGTKASFFIIRQLSV